MSKKEAIFLIAIVVVVIGGFYYYMKYIFKPAPKQPEIIVANTDTKPAHTIESQEWILPEELKEISANVFQDDTHMACIQDQDGVIYSYNLHSKSIDGKIEFAGKGDYEGL